MLLDADIQSKHMIILPSHAGLVDAETEWRLAVIISSLLQGSLHVLQIACSVPCIMRQLL